MSAEARVSGNGDRDVAGPRSEIHFVDNGGGWRLGLKRVLPRGATRGRPVIIVPGYQMNSSVFGFHPNGLSLEEHLASRGLEVWSADLRGQGRSVPTYGDDRFGLEALAIEDLGTAFAYVRAVSRAAKVDVLGCSLGTALAFAHLACVPGAERIVGSVVALGGVVTWADVNRVARLAARAPWLVGQLRMRGTRRLAGAALPVIARFAPQLLSVYLNVKSTDTSQPEGMIATVEDPNPVINREIAIWMLKRDLTMRGINVSRELPRMKVPFLCVIGRQDGIVPPATSRAIFAAIGSPDKALLEVGDEDTPIAHADLFLARRAPELVFEPVAHWLIEHGGASAAG